MYEYECTALFSSISVRDLENLVVISYRSSSHFFLIWTSSVRKTKIATKKNKSFFFPTFKWKNYSSKKLYFEIRTLEFFSCAISRSRFERFEISKKLTQRVLVSVRFIYLIYTMVRIRAADPFRIFRRYWVRTFFWAKIRSKYGPSKLSAYFPGCGSDFTVSRVRFFVQKPVRVWIKSRFSPDPGSGF